MSIDYRYNAGERIKVAVTHPDENMAQTGALIAQAEATLALVEQQRIANRIALAVAIRKDILLRGTATELSDWLNEGDGVRGYFSTAEKEDLGVE